ncbi:helix-turn-helix domain-containing protein [Jiangella muralis]|uniref:helix-turn-helix domain-containing protein n=1 Tax=Jiangella muralis TaxID=702383 RepID=UPI00069F8CE6|nr:helix-turn-helix domain-containing protein [Jiangella muralis]
MVARSTDIVETGVVPDLTRQDVAEMFGTSLAWVDGQIKDGRLTAYKVGGTLVRIRREDALALVTPVEPKASA